MAESGEKVRCMTCDTIFTVEGHDPRCPKCGAAGLISVIETAPQQVNVGDDIAPPKAADLSGVLQNRQPEPPESAEQPMPAGLPEETPDETGYPKPGPQQRPPEPASEPLPSKAEAAKHMWTYVIAFGVSLIAWAAYFAGWVVASDLTSRLFGTQPDMDLRSMANVVLLIWFFCWLFLLYAVYKLATALRANILLHLALNFLLFPVLAIVSFGVLLTKYLKAV